MANDRTVKVTLTAQVAQYIQGMEKASVKTRELGSDAEKLAAKKEAFTELGQASLAVGAMAAVGVGLAISKFAEFDQAVSNVKAATQESAENMGLLRDAALEAGASTVFSATESANAVEELAKAGISTADVLGGALTGSLDLASAGQLGVARAAEISATALQQFKLEGSEAGHVADVLAAGAGKAMGSVEDLANGLKFVGPVANSMGVSLEETTGVLALFAQQGIIGEQAGTSLRGVLASLTSPSSLARKEIERLGLQMYDLKTGAFLGLENAAGQLSKAYSTMDDESRAASMGVIFGRETITAATALYKAGAEGVDEWTTAVDDSGYAAQVAKDRLDNLAGDVEALGGAFDTALIQTGAAGNDVLRVMAQTLTNVIDLYNEAPEPVQATALAAGALAAAVGIAGGAFFLGAPKVAAFTAALATMGPTAQRAGAMVTAAAGPIGIAFAGATVALALFAGQQAAASALSAEFVDTLDEATGAVTGYTRELVAKKLSESGAFKAAKEAGVSQKELTEAVLEGGDALDKVNKKIGANNNLPNFFTGVGIRAGNAKAAIKGVAEGVAQSADDFDDQKSALEGSTGATEDNSNALEVLAEKADEAKEDLDALAAAIRGYGAEQLNVNDSTRAYEAAIDDLEQKLKDNGDTLDVGTEKGRENQSALDDLAKSTLDLAASTVEQTGKSEDANAVIALGREELIKSLGQFGITGEAAQTYADKLGLIPGTVQTVAELDTADAERKAENLRITLNSIQRKLVNALDFDSDDESGGGMADGGAVSGVGGPRQDNIVTRLSVGEHVFDAEDVRRMGGQSAVYRFRNSLYAGGMADGGAVGYRSNPSYGTHAGSSVVTNSGGNKTINNTTVIHEADDPYLAASIAESRFNKTLRGL